MEVKKVRGVSKLGELRTLVTVREGDSVQLQHLVSGVINVCLHLGCPRQLWGKRRLEVDG